MVNGARRVRIIPLINFDLAPFRLAINCHELHIRIQVYDGATSSLDGVLLKSMAGQVDPGTGLGVVALDFPPVFDGDGLPVAFNQALQFNPGAVALNGTVTMVYLDPSRPTNQGA